MSSKIRFLKDKITYINNYLYLNGIKVCSSRKNDNGNKELGQMNITKLTGAITSNYKCNKKWYVDFTDEICFDTLSEAKKYLKETIKELKEKGDIEYIRETVIFCYSDDNGMTKREKIYGEFYEVDFMTLWRLTYKQLVK